MRVKILVPEYEDFGNVVRELKEVRSVYIESERRRFIATDELPAKTQADLQRRGIKIVPDERYEVDID